MDRYITVLVKQERLAGIMQLRALEVETRVLVSLTKIRRLFQRKIVYCNVLSESNQNKENYYEES